MVQAKTCAACVGVVLIVASAGIAAGPATVLDQSSWLARYYRFASDQVSPELMESQGRQALGDALFERTKTATEKSSLTGGNDDFAVFRPSAVVLKEARRSGTIAAMRATASRPATPAPKWQELVFRRPWFDPYTAPPPPQDWASPAFDDSDWVMDRGPFQIDMPDAPPPEATKGNMATVHVDVLQYIGAGVHTACYRGRFFVDDPAKAGELSFSATFRGGLRVLVNGQEVARSHLPKGPLAAEAAADNYPLEAYANPQLRDRALDKVAIRPGLLRAGLNVLAIEARASRLHPVVLKTAQDKSWNALHDREGMWRHGYLGKFQLQSPDGAAASAQASRPGLHVWVEDMHRRVSSDEPPPPGQAKPVIRLVGARNGCYGAQLVLKCDQDMPGPTMTVEYLRGASGQILPGSAISVLNMLPFPAEEFSHKLGDERGLAGRFPTQAALKQHAGMADAGQRFVFDQITSQPQPLPAGRCRPMWISLRIPEAAPAGLYTGTLRIRPEGQGEIGVPIEVEVIGWRLPPPQGFQTYVGLEQNPYGVASQYGVQPWSEQHLELLEASFRQIARAGGTWLNVPVIRGTEFGNRDDSMIRWTRKADGSFAYDFSVLDKYLALAVANLGGAGKPQMINFVIMAGLDGPNFQKANEIMVTDEATGKAAPLAAGVPGVSLEEKKRIWLPFATALHEHLRSLPNGEKTASGAPAKGLEKAMHWGYPLDSEMDHELVALLGEHLPSVKWNGCPHQIGNWGYKEPKYYDVFGTVRYFNNWPGFSMSKGWKAPQRHLAVPRIDSSVQSLITASHPFGFRTLVNHSLALGRAGITRLGADEWASSHYAGMRVPTWIVGMPVLFTLWPGAQGAESSARHEALIEGIQEGEARIFLEKAIDAGWLNPQLARRAQNVLDRHYLQTTFFQNKLCIHELEKYHHLWQQRSRELYQAAADVAAAGR